MLSLPYIWTSLAHLDKRKSEITTKKVIILLCFNNIHIWEAGTRDFMIFWLKMTGSSIIWYIFFFIVSHMKQFTLWKVKFFTIFWRKARSLTNRQSLVSVLNLKPLHEHNLLILHKATNELNKYCSAIVIIVGRPYDCIMTMQPIVILLEKCYSTRHGFNMLTRLGWYVS